MQTTTYIADASNFPALDLAQSAYTSSAAPTRSASSIELDAFSRITRRLQRLGSGRGSEAFAQALHENRQLWTLLAIDVADAENNLPQSLRAQIFYLARFTDLHTSKILAGTADAAVLVDINTAMMRGLRQQEGRP